MPQSPVAYYKMPHIYPKTAPSLQRYPPI